MSTDAEIAEKEAKWMQEVREILTLNKIRFETVFALSMNGSTEGILVSGQNYGERKWRKAPCALYVDKDKNETLLDVIAMLLTLREEVRS